MKSNLFFFTIFIVCLVVISVTSASVLEIQFRGEPEIIYEFQEGYHFNTIHTDGTYILIKETQPNDLQLQDQATEGYEYFGNLYLYDIDHDFLTRIPGNIPPRIATISNGTVYWKSAKFASQIPDEALGNMRFAEYYYQYTPGDEVPVKINIPQNSGMIDFATDGLHLVMSRNEMLTEGKLEPTLTLFDLQTGDEKRIPVFGGLDPYSLELSGDYLIYSDSAMLIPDVNDRRIHIYSIHSGQTHHLEKRDGVGQSIRGLWGDNLFYAEYDLMDYPTIMESDYFLLNLTTNRTQSIEIQKDITSELIHPSVVVFTDIDESTGRQVVKFAHLDMPPVTQPIITTSNTEQTPPPQPTQAGSLLALTIGLIAFVLACVFAILWREK
ncbi:MAG: hypothetical protein O0X93_01035 [Methanocorpusculum sp.]|nr:hypothetical protein [Methanocorpusculum sp.]MDE2524061.1 hypothetical protein [Methanocorpusculum sp.]